VKTQIFRRAESYYKFLFLFPTILVLLSISLFPFIHQIYISFTNYRLGFGGDSFVGVENYRKVLFDSRFLHSILIWLKFAIIAVSLEMVLGFLMALAFNSIFTNATNAREFVLSILIIPMVLSPVVMGGLFRMMFSSEFGVFVYFLRLIGIDVQRSPLSSPVWVIPTLAFVDIWQWTPLAFLLIYAGLQGIERQLLEAAEVDGASYFQIIWKITIPLVRSEILIALLLLVFRSLKLFDTICSMTAGGPGIHSEVVNYYLYKQAFSFIETGQAAAIGVFILIIGFLLANIFTRFLFSELAKGEQNV